MTTITTTYSLAIEGRAVQLYSLDLDIDTGEVMVPAEIQEVLDAGGEAADAAEAAVLAAAADIIASVDPLGRTIDRELTPSIPGR